MNPCVTEQSLIRSEIHFVKDHNNKYTTPSIGFQSASFAMKKKTVGFQPRKRNIGFQSSQRSHLGHEATSNSVRSWNKIRNPKWPYNLLCTVLLSMRLACLHWTRINLRANRNIIYTGREPRIMYRNAAVQRGPLQPSVSKPIYRGYLGCNKSVENNPRLFCELNSKRWPCPSLHKIAVFGGSTSVLHICGYVFVDAVRGRSLCNECRL